MNARVLTTFPEPLSGPDGTAYVAKICGRLGPEGRWEGWVEFVPEGGTPVMRSRRETTQSSLKTLQSWAERLSAVYLVGSLERTLDMQHPRFEAAPDRPEPPHFDGPSPVSASSTEELTPDDAVLNPFLRLREGEATLRDELFELAPSELRMIVRAYHMDDEHPGEVDSLSGTELVELIVSGARRRTRSR